MKIHPTLVIPCLVAVALPAQTRMPKHAASPAPRPDPIPRYAAIDIVPDGYGPAKRKCSPGLQPGPSMDFDLAIKAVDVPTAKPALNKIVLNGIDKAGLRLLTPEEAKGYPDLTVGYGPGATALLMIPRDEATFKHYASLLKFMNDREQGTLSGSFNQLIFTLIAFKPDWANDFVSQTFFMGLEIVGNAKFSAAPKDFYIGNGLISFLMPICDVLDAKAEVLKGITDALVDSGEVGIGGLGHPQGILATVPPRRSLQEQVDRAKAMQATRASTPEMLFIPSVYCLTPAPKAVQ